MIHALTSTPVTTTTYTVVAPIYKLAKSKSTFDREVTTRAVAFFATSFFQAIDFLLNSIYAIGKLPLATLRAMGVKQLSSYEFSFTAIGQHICKAAKCIFGTLIGSIAGVIKPEFVYNTLCNIETESTWLYTDKKFNLNKQFNSISYISLASRPDKVKTAENYLKKMEVESTWLKAVDRKDKQRIVSILEGVGVQTDRTKTVEERYDDFLEKVAYDHNPNQRGGRLGCLLSHLTWLQSQRDQKSQRPLILEDDCIFVKGSQDHLEKAIKTIPNDWDMMFLGGFHCHPDYLGSVPGLDPENIPGNDHWQKANSLLCTHAYAINGAKDNGRVYDYLIGMITDSLKKATKDRPLQPIDVLYMSTMSSVDSSINSDTAKQTSKEWKQKNGMVKAYCLKQFIADQRPGISDIEDWFISSRKLARPINLV